MATCGSCGRKNGHLKGCPVLENPQKGKRPGREVTPKYKIKYETVTCPTCRGSGKRGIRNCGLCNGRGTILVPKED